MFALLMALLPGHLHRWIRVLRGQKIHKTASLRFGTILASSDVEIGPRSKVGPFVRISAHRLRIGSDTRIGPLVTISAYEVTLGSYSKISPVSVIHSDSSKRRSTFVMGDHTQIFPFCWLEPGHGIRLGDRVGIGGHGLIFTHGSWANYFLGAPVAFGPVVIEDRVWLPWRVFVMPNVTIGKGAIIGAGSVITRSILAESLAAGSPAVVIRQNSYKELNADALLERLSAVLADFIESHPAYPAERVSMGLGMQLNLQSISPILLGAHIDVDQATTLISQGTSVIDVCTEKAWLTGDDKMALALTIWLRTYGVRVDVQAVR